MNKNYLIAFILLGIATIIRVDMILALCVFALWCYLYGNRKQTLIYFGLTVILFIIPQFLFRYFYFGQLLPNTYYLKATGFPVELRSLKGLIVFTKFVWHLSIPLFVIAFLKWKNKYAKLLIMLFISHCSYSIVVGGDVWEKWGGANRFYVIVMPAFVILLSLAIERWHLSKKQIIAIIFISLLSINATPSYTDYPSGIIEMLFIKKPLHWSDNRDMVIRADIIENITTPQAKIAVTWGGIMPYFMNRECIDMLGKVDPIISHLPSRVLPEKWIDYAPGHIKWKAEYSIGELEPDVIAQFWAKMEDSYTYLQKDYIPIHKPENPIFLKRGSPNIKWELIK